jgi:ATP-dependent RNA helicase DDX52/ROK1
MSLPRIANVMLQSGSTVPEWMLKLPKPSRMKKRKMGKVDRGDAVTKDGQVGKADALQKKFVQFCDPSF